MFPDYPTVALDPIPGFPGYSACRLGIIFSLRSILKGSHPGPFPLKTRPDKDGYLIVGLYRDGYQYCLKVHTIILNTYVGPKPDGMECRHANNVRDDNRLSNLSWGTHAQNMDDLTRSGIRKGERHHRAKLRDSDIPTIRAMNATDAAEKFNISIGTAQNIIRRHSWKHIS